MPTWTRVEDAELEPVTLDEAKAQCRIDGTDDDALLAGYIKAARQYVEKRTSRALLAQTWRLSLQEFPLWRRPLDYIAAVLVPNWEPAILLPRPPLLAVTSVTYLDAAGVRQTVDPTLYDVDVDGEPGAVFLRPAKSWPAALRYRNSVQVTFTAGYGDSADDVPQTLKQAILMLVGHLYENREASVLPDSGTGVVTVPLGFDEFLRGDTFTTFSLNEEER